MSTAANVRVSTEGQNLDRQLESTREYAEHEFGCSLASLEMFRDKSTGTDTSLYGYQDMLETVNDGEVDLVVVHEISRLARPLYGF